eukprot:TRINITY_DN15146_c0_g1_i1.p1 TRINITY_DN15146_c0_g1~~TRINITY_DN15146_c0_g1_i1.p1  ORF type:complete len:307 (-),score=36.04 TRINITY_DN15146_c0_g1_i1:251-1171(-)
MSEEGHVDPVHNKKTKRKIRDKLLAEAETRLQALIELEASDQWTFKSKTKGVEIYTMNPGKGQSLDFVKGIGYANCTLEEFHVFLNSGINLLKQVDKMFSHGHDLGEVVPGKIVLAHAQFKAPGRPLISDRDFCYLSYDKPEAHCGISFDADFYADEIDKLGLKRMPPVPGVVRGSTLACAYFYRPVPGRTDQLKLTYVCLVDVKGWIPSWVANLTAGQQALNVHSIAKYFNRVHGRQTGDDDEVDGTEEQVVQDKLADVSIDPEKEKKKKHKKKKKSKKSKKQSEGPAPAHEESSDDEAGSQDSI